jgi:dethiobiotin synthetase
LHNEDAEKILAAASVHVPYEWVNPYSFVPPISPHLAAAQTSTCISIEPIVKAYQQLAELTDIVVVEGVGGWRVPINAQQGLREIVQSLQARVILVVGLRLGCINHALLSAETILRDGCQLVGWIANEIDPYFEVTDSVASIRERLAAPLLAHVPYMAGEMELQGNLIERVKR